MSSINELLKQVYPLNLRMELFNAIWTSWRAHIKEKDQQTTDLQNQLAIKALKELRDKFCNIGYNGDYDIDYFEVMKEIAKQIKQLKAE